MRIQSSGVFGTSSPSIAKIVYIGVAAQCRGRAIGKSLYLSLFKHLAACGVHRVDACIEHTNLPSVRVHQKAGWWIELAPRSYFATIDLR
jgi:ribosomal protein S18 acetylase RimI-like enzyme